ncbi:MAG: hypothetical protein M1133_12905 [Armatimonadetes bacterium]|nr:hypothetical protein [Armatimonadota bacterium]
MVRFRRIRLADYRGRDATVLLVPVSESIKRRHRDVDGRPLRSVRRMRATQDTCAEALLGRHPDPDELARSLIDGDPEIDLEMTGRASGPCDRVYIDGDGQILYAPSVVEVRCGPDGLERERRPLSVRPSNLMTPSPLVWSGVLLPQCEAVRRYAFTRAYQVMHTNALEFDFLRGIAAYLDERNAMVQVGSGRRGNGPLIPERNGPKYRGFLDGRIQGDSMRLVLYLAAFELAAPEERV